VPNRKQTIAQKLIYLISRVSAILLFRYVIRTRISHEGENNLTDHPTLFAANHFTRFETGILTYVHHKITGDKLMTLADSSIFIGQFGEWLKAAGAYPLQHPNRDNRMIGDLMTGRSCWAIFPEGSMVKNKQLWEKGKFVIDCPDKQGSPHTGAAVLALKAEIFKRSYLRAVEEKDRIAMQYYENTYGFSGPEEISRKSVVITPVCITYYPLRTDRDFPVRLLRRFLKRIPTRIEEELRVEWGYLAEKSDMHHSFGKPILLDEYVDYLMPIKRGLQRFFRSDDIDNLILEWQRNKLTQRCMHEIYLLTCVNMDMVLAFTLRTWPNEVILLEELYQRLYLSCLEILKLEHLHTHPSMRGNLIKIIIHEAYEPVENLIDRACNDGVLTRSKDKLIKNSETFYKKFHFHRVRLKNKLSVLANELEPREEVTKIIKHQIKMGSENLGQRIITSLVEEDHHEFQAELKRSSLHESENAKQTGQSLFLEQHETAPAILLAHNLLGSPHKIHGLAEALHERGMAVLCPRLKGHGTCTEELASTTWQDWVYSFERAYAILSQRHEKIILAGYSLGALLALLSASRKSKGVCAVIAINPAFTLQNPDHHLLRPLINLSKWVNRLRSNGSWMEWMDILEDEDSEYSRVSYATLHEWQKLRQACRKQLPRLQVPSLILQSIHDPHISHWSGNDIHKSIKFRHKELKELEIDSSQFEDHENSKLLCERIMTFIQPLLAGNKSSEVSGEGECQTSFR
jgi:esterase/lipase